jgi:amiloride-sensitive sodium channel
MLICAVVCIVQIIQVWTRYQVSPVIISFAQRPTRVSEIPFPAVTICPVMQIPRDVFDMDTVLEMETNDELTFAVLKPNLT